MLFVESLGSDNYFKISNLKKLLTRRVFQDELCLGALNKVDKDRKIDRLTTGKR
jgi:hypothetical protein